MGVTDARFSLPQRAAANMIVHTNPGQRSTVQACVSAPVSSWDLGKMIAKDPEAAMAMRGEILAALEALLELLDLRETFHLEGVDVPVLKIYSQTVARRMTEK